MDSIHMDKCALVNNKNYTIFTPNKKVTRHSNRKMGGCNISRNNPKQEIIITTIIIVIPVVLKLQIGTTSARATTKSINAHQSATSQPPTNSKFYLVPETEDSTSTDRGPSKEISIRETTNRKISNRGTPDGYGQARTVYM